MMKAVMVEATGTTGSFIDTHVVDTEDDVWEVLDAYLGQEAHGDLPTTLDFLDADANVLRVVNVLWVIIRGEVVAWRTIPLD